jgi:hypothetical protein
MALLKLICCWCVVQFNLGRTFAMDNRLRSSWWLDGETPSEVWDVRYTLLLLAGSFGHFGLDTMDPAGASTG